MGLESLFTPRDPPPPPLWTRGFRFGRGCPCPDNLKSPTLQQSPKGLENQAKSRGCCRPSEASSSSLPTPSGGVSSGLPQPAVPHPGGSTVSHIPCAPPHQAGTMPPRVGRSASGPEAAAVGVRRVQAPLWAAGPEDRQLQSWPLLGTQCCHLVAVGGPQHTPHLLRGLSEHPPGSKGWCRIKQILEEISRLAVSASFPSISLGCPEQGRQAPGRQGLRVLTSAPQWLWPLSPADRRESKAQLLSVAHLAGNPVPLLQPGPRAPGPLPLRQEGLFV